MDSQNQSAEEIFEAALDLAPDQRSAYLAKTCRGSPELYRTVEELLFDYERMGGFLDDPPMESVSGQPQSAGASILGHALNPGMRLGRYTILEPLGAGGMGAVYRALDEKLERSVAVKVLSPGVLTGDDARRRFRKEAMALAKLSHAHIAAVYDVGEQDGVDYLVMECVPGETLAAKLEQGPLSVKEATTIVLQIAEALEDAHERGVVHRDLKPANVMITPKGQVKVLDFGLAKLLAASSPDGAVSMMETGILIGTPFYMSPEQAQGMAVDARSDVWSLGVVYYELLTGRTPFHAKGNIAILHAIIKDDPPPVRQSRPDAPALACQIIAKSLEKDPAARYQSSTEAIRDASDLLSSLTAATLPQQSPERSRFRMVMIATAVALVLTVATSLWFFHRMSQRQWAREEAIPQIRSLLAENKPLAAFALLEKAQTYLPADPQLKLVASENTSIISITSSPSAADIEIEDYSTPSAPWHHLGVTPLGGIRIPKGYFRWRVTKSGLDPLVAAPRTSAKMDFALGAAQSAPKGMVLAPGGIWTASIDFVGFVGPYKLPPYYVDRYEVTNRDYQKFVDAGGYSNPEYWVQPFTRNGRNLPRTVAMAIFRDTTGRPGPSTWVAGHFAEGQADFPVAGVSWFEASAYAAFAGKSLPVFAQWYQTGPPELARHTLAVSNISSHNLAPVGKYQGIGPYGTYDMAGNIREWVANSDDTGFRFILGGAWDSPSYLYFEPQSLSPFDRSPQNGFRCVKNLGTVPEEAEVPVRRATRDFVHYQPVSDSVFHAYELLYAYNKTPLNAKSEGPVQETVDWREEKVTFDTAYRGERMPAYLFLPKNVRPPYQTVLFFPSARVLFLSDNKDGRELGDVKFFDYILQSGRAVMYPVYENMYERTVKFSLPRGAQNIQLTTEWYKDAARSLDYLSTRPDIDSGKLAYLGVSMGSAEGVIASTLLQDRLKTAVFLDGGYFLDQPPPGGDQADFAPRMKKPVLMVNGRYDYTFSLEKSQNPLFSMLGTPEKDKRHIVLDTPHDVTEQRPQLVHGVLDWLDHYLGRVDGEGG